MPPSVTVLTGLLLVAFGTYTLAPSDAACPGVCRAASASDRDRVS